MNDKGTLEFRYVWKAEKPTKQEKNDRKKQAETGSMYFYCLSYFKELLLLLFIGQPFNHHINVWLDIFYGLRHLVWLLKNSSKTHIHTIRRALHFFIPFIVIQIRYKIFRIIFMSFLQFQLSRWKHAHRTTEYPEKVNAVQSTRNSQILMKMLHFVVTFNSIQYEWQQMWRWNNWYLKKKKSNNCVDVHTYT